MSVTTVRFEGTETSFHVENMHDHIQGFHVRGEFYEARQLLAHRDLICRQAIVIDVGANIGNHTLFYARHTHAARIYPIEANPAAIEILRKNVAINPVVSAAIDLRHVGLAVGAVPGRVRLAKSPENNLGGTSFASSDDASDIALVRLDDLQFDEPIGLLKIDVEGGELDVLTGAERIVAQFRPAIAIEVRRRNERMFWAWVGNHKYELIDAFFDYENVKNYVLVPIE